MGIWEGGKKAGGTTVVNQSDPEIKSVVEAIYRKPGSTIKPNEEVFVLLSDGTPVNVKNKLKKNITVPDQVTLTSLTDSELSLLVNDSDVNEDAVIDVWLSQRSAWVAVDRVDFTTAEPVITGLAPGDVVMNTITGIGSRTIGTTFKSTSLYYVNDVFQWTEYPAKEGYTVDVKELRYKFLNGAWVQELKNDHLHFFVGDAATKTYRAFAGKKEWVNKVDVPDLTIKPGESGWADNWKDDSIQVRTSNTGTGTDLPADNADFDIFVQLNNPFGFPNGTFAWDATATMWVQIDGEEYKPPVAVL